jgi:polysaccharide deacetylase 2 family uncharacterized protein YibQ
MHDNKELARMITVEVAAAIAPEFEKAKDIARAEGFAAGIEAAAKAAGEYLELRASVYRRGVQHKIRALILKEQP